jgi:hypothetical protein
MKFLVAGASVSAGAGLQDGKLDRKLWVNQLLTKVYKCSLNDISNISIIGIDNKQIFKLCSQALVNNQIDVAVVAWQSMPRTNFNFGLETYNTRFPIVSAQPTHDIQLVNNEKVSSKELSKIQKFLLTYYNYHHDISDLIHYINILNFIAEQNNTKIFFVNYNLPWQTQRFFDFIEWTTPDTLDRLTQTVLNFEIRDDTETKKLYNLIHHEYLQLGGICEHRWLNLYEPLRLLEVDKISKTDPHPGYLSQDIFSKKLYKLYSERM